MSIWRSRLRSDPVELLLTSKYVAVRYFTRRDLFPVSYSTFTPSWRMPSPMK